MSEIYFTIAGYSFFLKKRMLYLNQKGITPKIVFLGVAVIFSLDCEYGRYGTLEKDPNGILANCIDEIVQEYW